MANEYILRGLDENGKEYFYTGRAGEGFISKNRNEAFDAYNLAGAQHRATMLNCGTALHGIRFIAIKK